MKLSSPSVSELLDKLALQGETVRILKTAKAEKVNFFSIDNHVLIVSLCFLLMICAGFVDRLKLIAQLLLF